MPNKLSNSKLNQYTDCGRKYKLYYLDKLRSKYISSALLFGSAIDKGLNELLSSKNTAIAKKVFSTEFQYFKDAEGNVQETAKSPFVQYSSSDLDPELLTEEDLKCPENEHNWWSLLRKGLIMIDSYAKDMLPRITKVIAVQEPISLKNEEGDELVGFLDIVVQLDDGKTYLLDHKTSSRPYEPDSAGKSQQLLIYHHEAKEKFGIQGVGFIVLKKQIAKNKTKVCSKCGYDGSGAKHKTCPNETETGEYQTAIKQERCNGEWKTTITPTCSIDLILNDVKPAMEDLVISAFDSANAAIKKEVFLPNLQSCMKYGKPCDFYKLCWEGSDSDLVKVK